MLCVHRYSMACLITSKRMDWYLVCGHPHLRWERSLGRRSAVRCTIQSVSVNQPFLLLVSCVAKLKSPHSVVWCNFNKFLSLRSSCACGYNHCDILNNWKTTGKSVQRVERFGIFTQEPRQSVLQRRQFRQKVERKSVKFEWIIQVSLLSVVDMHRMCFTRLHI